MSNHRQILDLPIEGLLKVSQIKMAFRLLAKKSHPDTGGSHEQFIEITKAHDALLNISHNHSKIYHF